MEKATVKGEIWAAANCCPHVVVSKRDTAAEPWQRRAVASASLPEAGCDPEGPADRHSQSTHRNH